MKEIILSSDGESIVFLVPDVVAENLREYCVEFSRNWLWNSPDAKRYHKGGGVCYDESTFIDYLNHFIFPNEQSMMVKNLGWTELGHKLPPEYANHPYYNF